MHRLLICWDVGFFLSYSEHGEINSISCNPNVEYLYRMIGSDFYGSVCRYHGPV